VGGALAYGFMANLPRAHSFDLAGLRLAPGEGRRLDLAVPIDPFEFGGEHYPVASTPVPVRVDVSRTIAQGYVLRLRFTASLEGPCMRCLESAAPMFEVDALEVSQPGEGDELESPYVVGGVLDVAGWSRDSLALMLPGTLLCRPDCAGLCPVCGANLNEASPEHHHDPEPDARWAKLAELRFDGE
jgi:uncharacterized protein